MRTGAWGNAARYDDVPSSAQGVEIFVDGVSQGVSAQATDLLATGEFRFASVPPGRHTLVIAANGTRIVVADVDLESR